MKYSAKIRRLLILIKLRLLRRRYTKVDIRNVEDEIAKYVEAQKIIDSLGPTEAEKKLMELISKYLLEYELRTKGEQKSG